MYTLTIKIAAGDTKYTNKKGESHLSDFGHMWYSISNGGTPESYGFAPKDGNLIPFPRSQVLLGNAYINKTK